MDRNLLILLVVISLSGLYILLFSNNDSPAFEIYGEPSSVPLIKESNTVIIRLEWPFSHTQPPTNALTFLNIVLSAKGKHVIVQAVEGNICYTNYGEVNDVIELPPEECYSMPYPYITIREGDNRIIYEENGIIISSLPQYMGEAAVYIGKILYPDAEEVYSNAMKIAGRTA